MKARKADYILLIGFLTMMRMQMSSQSPYLSDSTISPLKIIANCVPAEENWLSDKISEKRTSFLSAYLQNVFDYFQLNEKYDSPLKKATYKQTPEYKILADSLEIIYKKFLSSTYYEYFNPVFNLRTGEDYGDYITNYDIIKKGFEIPIGEVRPFLCERWCLPKVIEEVEFRQLLISKKYNVTYSSRSYTQYLFVPVTDSIALEMENSRANIEIIRVFTIKGVAIRTYADNDFQKEKKGKTCKVDVVRGGDMRLIIYNRLSNKIYYDKLFLSTPSK